MGSCLTLPGSASTLVSRIKRLRHRCFIKPGHKPRSRAETYGSRRGSYHRCPPSRLSFPFVFLNTVISAQQSRQHEHSPIRSMTAEETQAHETGRQPRAADYSHIASASSCGSTDSGSSLNAPSTPATSNSSASGPSDHFGAAAKPESTRNRTRNTTPRSPSISSSSEAHDRLAPLPSRSKHSLPREFASSPAKSTKSPQNPQTSRFSGSSIPLPSPPALGLSELLIGSPSERSSQTSYFPVHKQKPIDSSPVSHAAETQITSGPQSPTSSASSVPRQSPRIRNEGSILAPHGTFTSARPTAKQSRRQTTIAFSDSVLQCGRYIDPLSVLPSEVEDLRAAAMKGDQLASYRLGWRSESLAGQQHRVGTVEGVWGSASP